MSPVWAAVATALLSTAVLFITVFLTPWYEETARQLGRPLWEPVDGLLMFLSHGWAGALLLAVAAGLILRHRRDPQREFPWSGISAALACLVLFLLSPFASFALSSGPVIVGSLYRTGLLTAPYIDVPTTVRKAAARRFASEWRLVTPRGAADTTQYFEVRVDGTFLAAAPRGKRPVTGTWTEAGDSVIALRSQMLGHDVPLGSARLDARGLLRVVLSTDPADTTDFWRLRK